MGNSPRALTTLDLNGDGAPDLIVANYYDNTVSVLLNTTAPGATTPSFATQQTFATGTHPFYLAAADVNGDGKPDLAVANRGDNTVGVLLNTTAPGATTASFAPQQTFGTGSNPANLVFKDVNGDGRLDLLVANRNDNSLSVLVNTTAPGASVPSFANQETFATGTTPLGLAVGDLNGDGLPDVVILNFVDNTLSVLLNTTVLGEASVTPDFPQTTFASGAGPNSVAVGDLNGDGKPDIITANEHDNTISVLVNTTTPGSPTLSFANQQTFGGAYQTPRFLTVADVNGDGKPDVLTAYYDSDVVAVLLNGTVTGSTTVSFTSSVTLATGSSKPRSVSVGDVNGDGKPDVLVTDYTGTAALLLFRNTTTEFTAHSIFRQSATHHGGDQREVCDAGGRQRRRQARHPRHQLQRPHVGGVVEHDAGGSDHSDLRTGPDVRRRDRPSERGGGRRQRRRPA